MIPVGMYGDLITQCSYTLKKCVGMRLFRRGGSATLSPYLFDVVMDVIVEDVIVRA